MADKKRLDIAVLISGRGSNLQALIDACAKPDFPARIVCVISNKADAYGLERAKAASIPTHVVLYKDYGNRQDFDNAIDETLRQYNVGLVCLAGFMRILSTEFVNRWRDRLINIHPSLLPAFKGLHTHERTIESGVRIAGCTVHFVRPEMDNGPIIIQAAVPVHADDTPETLAARILEQEHVIYPEAVRLIAMSQVRVLGSKVMIRKAQNANGALVNPAAQTS
jgi:phosphoribosylglycinamide formyltransferase-1